MRGVNPANVISSGSFTSSKSEIKRRNSVHPLYTRIDIPCIKIVLNQILFRKHTDLSEFIRSMQRSKSCYVYREKSPDVYVARFRMKYNTDKV